jgi:protein-tyrosine phosphatase
MSLRGNLRRILPAWVGRLVDDWHALPAAARPTYLRLRAARALGWRRDRIRHPGHIRNILVICHGNIIRSPFAEHLLRQEMLAIGRPDISVDSAGLHAKDGREADVRARQLARTWGVSLDSHRARLLLQEHLTPADLVLVMDHRNEAELLAQFNVASDTVLLLAGLSDRDPRYGAMIPDPYGGDAADVEACFRSIRQAVFDLSAHLTTEDPRPFPGQHHAARPV